MFLLIIQLRQFSHPYILYLEQTKIGEDTHKQVWATDETPVSFCLIELRHTFSHLSAAATQIKPGHALQIVQAKHLEALLLVGYQRFCEPLRVFGVVELQKHLVHNVLQCLRLLQHQRQFAAGT